MVPRGSNKIENGKGIVKEKEEKGKKLVVEEGQRGGALIMIMFNINGEGRNKKEGEEGLKGGGREKRDGRRGKFHVPHQ